MPFETCMVYVRRRAQRIRELLAWHPEWWTVGLSVGAWLMVLSMNNPLAAPICSSPSSGSIDKAIAAFRIHPIGSEFSLVYISWLTMTIAMMFPLTILSERHVAFRSFRWRRNRAIAGFLIGYGIVWAVLGAALAPMLIAARALDVKTGRFALMLAFIIAAVWQLTSTKSCALRKCHRTIALAPNGWRASRDCLCYGLQTGANCVLSCWALMIAQAYASHMLLAMICVESIILHERYELRPKLNAAIPVVLSGAALVLFNF